VLLQRIANLSGHFNIVSLPETHKLLHDFGHTVDELVLEIKGQTVSEVTGLDGDSNRELNDKETEVWKVFASVIFKADLILSYMASNTKGDFNETIKRELEELKGLEKEAKKKLWTANNEPDKYPNVQDLVKEHLDYFNVTTDDPEIYCRYYLVLKALYHPLEPIPLPAPVVLGEGELADKIKKLNEKARKIDTDKILEESFESGESVDRIRLVEASIKTAIEEIGLKEVWKMFGKFIWEEE
jgi:hypothetical protein